MIFSPCLCRMILAGEVGLLVARESLFVSEDRLQRMCVYIALFTRWVL